LRIGTGSCVHTFFVKRDWDNCGAVGRELLKKSSIVVFVSQDGRDPPRSKRYQAALPFAEYPQHDRWLLRTRDEGHATAAPPSSVMNARRCSGRDVRFIARPPHRTVRAAFPHTARTSGI
jgi:hypothetical protein